MQTLILAALLAQGQPAPDPCYAAAVPPGQAGCPTWRLVMRDERSARYFDPASGVRNGDTVDVMTRTVLPAPAQGALTWLARMRLDCARRTFMILHVTSYNDAGVQVMDQAYTDEPRPVREGHDATALLAEFCLQRPVN